MTLEDKEGLSEYKDHMEKHDADEGVAETANWFVCVLDILYQSKAVLYHAARPESCMQYVKNGSNQHIVYPADYGYMVTK